MTTPEDNSEAFTSESQNAIFQFLFVLVEEYQQEMPYSEAIEKACDWLISLASTVKEKSATVVEEKMKFTERFK